MNVKVAFHNWDPTSDIRPAAIMTPPMLFVEVTERCHIFSSCCLLEASNLRHHLKRHQRLRYPFNRRSNAQRHAKGQPSTKGSEVGQAFFRRMAGVCPDAQLANRVDLIITL